jgi:hypothetical protein
MKSFYGVWWLDTALDYESGRGLPQSKTLSRAATIVEIPSGFGLRQSSAALYLVPPFKQ